MAARRAHRLLQHLVAQRVERRETQVLQFHAQRVDAEPVGDRRVDVQRLARDSPALVRAHDAQRAHVVQAVGQLHQDDADIAHHGQDHLAEVFRLRLGRALELDLGELAHAVHQFRNVTAEFGGDLFLGGGRVLDHVVQDGGDDGLVIETQLGEDARRGNRVIDVGLAGQAGLAVVGLGTEQIGAVHLLDLRRLQVGLQHLAQVTDQKARGRVGEDFRSVCHRVTGGQRLRRPRELRSGQL